MDDDRFWETDRLLIRPTDESDAQFVADIMNTPKWLSNIGDRGVRTRENALRYIRDRIIAQRRRLGFSNFPILRKSDRVKVGVCGLYDRPGLNDVDIGFALMPEFEGNGYALEAATRVKDLAFKEFGLKRLLAISVPLNIASHRILKKLGMVCIGKVRLDNDGTELLLFELKSEDMQGRDQLVIPEP